MAVSGNRTTKRTCVAAALSAGLTLLVAGPASAVVSFEQSPSSPLPFTNPAPQVGDLNGDSRPDLAVVSGGEITILRGDGTGGFEQVGMPISAVDAAASLAIGSLNADAVPDLAVASSQNYVQFLYGAGDGTFIDAQIHNVAGGELAAVAIGNINNDGFGDVAALINDGSGNGSITPILANGGIPSFGPPSPTGTKQATSIAMGSLNADGFADAAVSSLSGNPPNFHYMASLLGAADGGLTPASGSPFSASGDDGRAVVLDDFDGDTNLDVAVTNEHTNTVGVRLGAGDGTFSLAPGSPFTVGENPWGLASGYVNSGSTKDLLVGNDDGNSLDVLTGTGLGGFTRAGAGPFPLGGINATWVGAGDFDGDGKVDAAVATNTGIILLRNTRHAPAAPVVTDTDPDSPANQNSIFVKGTVEPGVSPGTHVDLYAGSNCSSGIDHRAASEFASPGIPVNVGDNTTTVFSARVADAEGSSPCSTVTRTYVEDSSVPAAPTLGPSVPSSPSTVESPSIQGSAEPGSFVKLYATADCSGSPLAMGGASLLAGGGIPVTVPSNEATDLRATATDAAGNTSPCTASPFTYVEDSVGPGEPTVLDTAPGSPANGTSLQVRGVADPGSTVDIFATVGCTGSPLGSGAGGAFASPGVMVSVPANTTTTFRARARDGAGNLSPCSSTSTAYEEDSIPPPPPALTTTAPRSPSNMNQPDILGAAQAGSVVRLYGNGTCAGSHLTVGSAASLVAPGLPVLVGDDSTTSFSATATDAAGNVSPCSAAVAYVEDSTAAETMLDSVRVRGRRVAFAFHSPLPVAGFECRLDGRPFGHCESPAHSGRLGPGNHTIHVRSVDEAGNRDPSPAARRFQVKLPRKRR